MELKLTDAEMQEVRRISKDCDQEIEILLDCLERLTWRDGLLGFRMQAEVGELLPWMKQISALSDRVNRRLEESGVPLGPSLKAYKQWEKEQKQWKKKQKKHT